jgi:hypothetical protein
MVQFNCACPLRILPVREVKVTGRVEPFTIIVPLLVTVPLFEKLVKFRVTLGSTIRVPPEFNEIELNVWFEETLSVPPLLIIMEFPLGKVAPLPLARINVPEVIVVLPV